MVKENYLRQAKGFEDLARMLNLLPEEKITLHLRPDGSKEVITSAGTIEVQLDG